MGKPGKSSSRSRQPLQSKALRRLRDSLGLDPADWQAFLGHARNGFADYERAHSSEYNEPLDLPDVPAEWFDDPEPLGYVVIRVLREADADLAAPVAQFFLHFCDPAADHVMEPPGMGLAWLYLVQRGQSCPVEPVRLAHVAMQIPEQFFQGVAEEELLALGRLVLEAKGPPEAWDLQALVAAVGRAQLHAHAPFRLFDGLMSVNWISREAKRELCRGLLGCSPEEDRLRERSAAINDRIEADSVQMDRIPRVWMELAQAGLHTTMPGLRRHAVMALVEGVGEPAPDVIEEFLLRPRRQERCVEMVYQGALDVLEARAQEFGPDATRRFLNKAIAGRAAALRHAAYRIGLKQFGPEFARRALKDAAGSVRKWAAKVLASAKTRQRDMK